eukprot:jgi/Botrbrau1/11868/Bobra.126_2s0004.2
MAYHEGLGETLIPAINRLHDIFAQVSVEVKLDLPQIAVVGSQSSGKSSVLEGLVGRDFLPRGPDICTRRPLVLQLVKHVQAPGTNGAEWGEFLHLPGKRFYDFERIRQEILTETERIVGSNKGVSDKPIRLKICSPNVLTMTLVDLPGITRVPVGDQPSDIEARIRSMILEYIKHPTCIILAVSPSNADLGNSDALEIARTVDPDGSRTVGVMTKLDIMDRGTDASAILRNQVIPLRLGYNGVVNRSQHDIASHMSMREARAAEAAFFQSHPEYGDVLGQCGMPALARCLNRILVEHIRATLPDLRSSLEQALEARRGELKIYGDAPPGQTGAARGALLLQLLDSYAVRYGEMLDGRSVLLPVSELAGGARIRHIFQQIFVNSLNQLDPSSELSDENMRTAIKNSGGVKGTLLIPDAPFELLVRRAINRLLAPALQCKEFVHSELLRVAAQCVPPDVARFPRLQARLVSAVQSFIDEGARPAERMIRDFVDCERSYINTDHPGFIGGSRAIAEVMDRRQAGEDADSRQSDDVSESRALPPGPSSSTAPHVVRQGGRLPVPENRSAPGLKGVRTSVRGHPLKGMEPELYDPDDLLDRSWPPLQQPIPPAPFSWLGSWFSAPDPRASVMSSDTQLAQPPFTLRVANNMTEQEEVQVEVTRVLVQNYFDIVRKNLQDTVPKAIMNFLVTHVQRGLQQHLIRELYKEELFTEMMSEREDVANKRKECQEAVEGLSQALHALETLPSALLHGLSSRSGSHGGRLQAPQDNVRRFSDDTQSSYGSRLPPPPRPYSPAARLVTAALATAAVE